MKTSCLILLTMGWTGLLGGIAYGTTSGDASPQTERAVTPHPSRHLRDTLSPRAPRERAGLQGGDQRPLPRGPRGEGGRRRRPGEGSFGTINNTAPVRPPSVGRPTAAPLANVRPGAQSGLWSAGRHRGSNPATVSGLGNRTPSNTGSIDGGSVRRRP